MKKNRKSSLILGSVLTALLLTFGCAPVQTEAAIKPGNEIKFNLNPEQFTESEIKKVFSAKKKEESKVYYFDASDQTFAKADYTHRLRFYKGKKKMDVTYKKAIKNKSVQEAIQIAEQHGFTGKEKDYKFEIDRKGGESTFAISRKEKLKVSKSLTYDSFDADDARQLLMKNAPKKMVDWKDSKWYKSTLEKSIAIGPAEVTAYEGSYLGHDADIEVWKHKGAQMVEISTKEKKLKKVIKLNELWENELQSADYLSSDQRSKTDFVMDK